MDVFNIRIEFDHDKFRQVITDAKKNGKKGYVCVVDFNVLTMTHKNPDYCRIVRNAYVNTCDGSSIATMVNHIYGTDYRAFNGPDVFEEIVENPSYKQLLLGNTEDKFNRIKEELKSRGKSSEHLYYMPVPFATVDEFDYKGIAEELKAVDPDIVWVSLGAPKQEQFMERLLPHIDRGLLFGIGAAFNFYVGDIRQPKFHIGAFRFIWLDRIFREPKKQLARIWGALTVYPKLYREEKKRAKLANNK